MKNAKFQKCSLSTNLYKEEIERRKDDEFLILIDEIAACVQQGMYRVALASALTLPDICSKVYYNTDKSAKSQYVSWCDEFLQKDVLPIYTTYGQYEPLSSSACYQLRCAVLHSGSSDFELDEKGYKIVLRLYIPKNRNSEYYINTQSENSKTKERYMFIDVRALCDVLCSSAKLYYDQCCNKVAFRAHTINIRDSAKINRGQQRYNNRKYGKVARKIVEEAFLPCSTDE